MTVENLSVVQKSGPINNKGRRRPKYHVLYPYKDPCKWMLFSLRNPLPGYRGLAELKSDGNSILPTWIKFSDPYELDLIKSTPGLVCEGQKVFVPRGLIRVVAETKSGVFVFTGNNLNKTLGAPIEPGQPVFSKVSFADLMERDLHRNPRNSY